jgi:hypothetical protein
MDSNGEKNRYSKDQSAASHNGASLRRNSVHIYGKRLASRSRQKREVPRLPSGKQWPSKFHTPRGFERLQREARHDVSFEHDTSEVTLLGNGESSGNPVCVQGLFETFLGDNEGAIPSWEARIVRDFFLAHQDHNETVQGVEPWVWMDDREHPSGRSRVIARGLTLPQLHEELKKKVSCIFIGAYCTRD